MVAQPGVDDSITAVFTPLPPERAQRLAATAYGLTVTAIHRFDTERDDTFLLTVAGPAGGETHYVLKVANPADDVALIEMQCRALDHVARTDPGLPVPRVVLTAAGTALSSAEGADGESRVVRLLSYLPGGQLEYPSIDAPRRRAIGAALGRLSLALRDFDHPMADRVLAWDLQHLPALRPHLACIRDDAARDEVAAELARFDEVTAPLLARVRHQVVHNDANVDNVVVDEDGWPCGILDFGDMVRTAVVADLAVAMAYAVPEDGLLDPWAAPYDLAVGFAQARPLTPEEWTVLPDLVRARMAQRMLVNSWLAETNPHNAHHTLRANGHAIAALRRLAAVPAPAVPAHAVPADPDADADAEPDPTPQEPDVAVPRTVGPSSYFDPATVDRLDPATAGLVRRRLEVLGPAYRLFYEQPLEIVRGQGVHLYAADGTEYLDVYNNVPSAGHAHPRVTAAIADQAAVLNTHTRYLHDGIVRYAEELLATLPQDLGHVMFTCTGSEAGDLALRIIKHHTGRAGVVVTRNAYHGVTTEIAAISPSLVGIDGLAPWVRVVEAPDAYHVDHVALGFASLGDWFAAQVQSAIDDLEAAGIGFAAFVADSIFASDGVLPDPAGFLAPVREVVRRAGGVYLADEVQPGFGRLGDTMWGFERHGTAAAPFVPDVVTIGKPMGNGMPIAATIVSPEVMAEFGRDLRYFNTFGGNAVSIAAAQAVLDVVRDEDLQGNAARVGSHLLTSLRELSARHGQIGDVRGAGLFLGVELVRPGTREPDEQLALAVVNELRQRHVLIGTAGIHNNTLKVRPPLVFSVVDADRFVTELDGSLTALAR